MFPATCLITDPSYIPFQLNASHVQTIANVSPDPLPLFFTLVSFVFNIFPASFFAKQGVYPTLKLNFHNEKGLHEDHLS